MKLDEKRKTINKSHTNNRRNSNWNSVIVNAKYIAVPCLNSQTKKLFYDEYEIQAVSFKYRFELLIHNQAIEMLLKMIIVPP